MKEKLYLNNGYLNMEYIFNSPYTFIIIIGGRAIGKTYGALLECVQKELKFIYFRRTQIQLDESMTKETNVFKSLNMENDFEVLVKKNTKNSYRFFEEEEDVSRETITEIFRGYGMAISTFANIRGFDGSDIDILLFDEFVPEAHQMTIRNEDEAIFNIIESINRNRELKGRKPVKCIFLSNSVNLANPLFMSLGLVTRAIKMKEKGLETYTDKNRSLALIMPNHSKISESKKETALYKLTKNTSFYEAAINNEFTNNHSTNIKSRNIVEFRPLVFVGELCIYQHKYDGTIYVTTHKSGNCESYKSSDKELMIFRKNYGFLLKYVYCEKVQYENYACEYLFDKYINM